MESLFTAPAPVGSSRVKGCHVRLRELRRFVLRSAQTLRGRWLSESERLWLGRAHDVATQLVSEGDQLVTDRFDPKIARRARKRPR